MFIFSSFIYPILSNSELLQIWITPLTIPYILTNSDPTICGLYMWGRFCAMLRGNPNWKFLLNFLLAMTGFSFSNLSICTDLSFQRCRKAFPSVLAAPCKPERIKHLLLTALLLPEPQSSPSRGEAAAWAEPLTSCFQSHFSLNQPCQSLALPGRNLSLPISPPPPSKGSFLLVFQVMFINQEEEVDESSWLLGRWKIKSRGTTTPENDKSNPTGTLLTSLAEGFPNSGTSPGILDPWFNSEFCNKMEFFQLRIFCFLSDCLA